MTSNIKLLSIDDVLEQMEAIIQRCINENSKLGFFAALYRNVTIEVKDRIKAGYFEDSPRMEILDVVFAQRYINAMQQFWDGKTASNCWMTAFNSAKISSPIILQHLMLGMNAHINFDLSIATAQVAPGQLLPKIKNDFDRIMYLLSDMIDEIEDRVEKVSPVFRAIDRIGGRGDEKFAGFAINKARELAWGTAEKLSKASPKEYNTVLFVHDKLVTTLANGIVKPSLLVKAGLKLIQAQESSDIPYIIKTLMI